MDGNVARGVPVLSVSIAILARSVPACSLQNCKSEVVMDVPDFLSLVTTLMHSSVRDLGS